MANLTPPIIEPGVEWHYSAYKFTNARATDACVTIQLYYYGCGFTEPCPPEITCRGPVSSGICGGVGAFEVAVYRDAFDPSDIRKNYLADSTRINAGFTQDHIELTVRAASDFVIVVSTPQRGSTVGNGLGYDPYFDLWVVGCAETDGGAPAPSESPPAPGAASDDDTVSGPSVGPAPLSSTEAAGSGCGTSGTRTSAVSLAALGVTATALVIRRRRTSRRTQ
ncbi:hypothetical protein AKJ09_06032 [Labilithrix luteola]|uniref:Uncharacterized protein n=1 Tax=Labilithrix luteola TaxID=1391654 RepID=A0A0K1Q0Q7_9BACT|nr:hypothetical protein AKJ09_06032 [Labilithrix luteola]